MLKINKCMFSRVKLVTTPIFYVNAQPHIGHLYTAILADAIKESYIIQGYKAYLSTGTDEHGLKVYRKAKENNMDTKAFCDLNSRKFKELFDLSEIRYDNFIRTTDDKHKNEVYWFWHKMAGKISKSSIFVNLRSIFWIL
jgi:methionyl-tRNA synthetase